MITRLGYVPLSTSGSATEATSSAESVENFH
jgi:hypothetical protein